MNSHATASSTVSANPDYGMDELRKESRMGDLGVETTAREVRRIDLSNFEPVSYTHLTLRTTPYV